MTLFGCPLCTIRSGPPVVVAREFEIDLTLELLDDFFSKPACLNCLNRRRGITFSRLNGTHIALQKRERNENYPGDLTWKN